jgi:large subunit ribosomal protein L17
MRKRIFGRRLKRDTNERKALFRSLMSSLVINGKIRTSEAKAKSIKAEIEKLVTHAKNDGQEAKKLILGHIPNEKVVDKIISEIAPKFATRNGGYTRILKMGPRVKDGAKMVLMSWVEEVNKTSFKEPKRKVSRGKDNKSVIKRSRQTKKRSLK